MSVIVRSLVNRVQTLDSVALNPFEMQVRSASTAALVAAVAAKTIQMETYQEMLVSSSSDLAILVGAAPAVTGLSCSITKNGPLVKLDFTLDEVELTVTDTGAGGSSASLKIFDFVQGVVVPMGCRQDYTAFVEGAALTTAVGDADHVLALGSAAANAGDGALTGTEVDFGSATGTITNVAGTGAGTQVNGASATALNGSATAVDLYLNWSGSAATIDANSTIGVTGTITVLCSLLGDD